jgi:two-component sensor histidine kinase/ligand-binding sensor domain-containing protein
MQRLLRKLFSLLCLCLLIPSGIGAQQYDFTSYSVAEGLSQSDVRCVFQDQRGFLWVGTTGGGVCSFDGERFKEYGKKNGLIGELVFCMDQDKYGNMWFGTNEGISCFNGREFRNFGNKYVVRPSTGSIVAYKDSIWFATEIGVFVCLPANEGRVVKKLDVTSTNTFLAGEENNTVWAGSGRKLYRFAAGKTDTISILKYLSAKSEITSLYSDRRGLLYIGLSDGLIIYRPSTATFTENEFSNAMKGKTVTDIYNDKEGSLWACTRNNLILKYESGGEYVYYDRSNGMLAENVLKVIEDNTHHFWFATREEGLLKLRSETFTYFGNIPSFRSHLIFALAEDADGKIWAGSYDDGVYVYDPKVKHDQAYAVLNNGVKFESPTTIIRDSKNQMWVGHKKGATCFINGRAARTLVPSSYVRCIYNDSKGNIWIGTFGDGLYCYDGTSTKLFTTSNSGLTSNYVYSFCEDNQGLLFIGTNVGISIYDGKVVTPFDKNNLLCNSYVGGIIKDKAGVLWMYTDGCIARYDGKKWITYTNENGLASNTFYLIGLDKNNFIWVGTNKGVDRLQVDANGKIISIKNFSGPDGFRGIECNSRAICTASDGRLWFGTIGGVIRYDEKLEKKIDYKSEVYITGIRMFLEEVDWSTTNTLTGWFPVPQQMNLDYQDNHLTFEYKSINLYDPESVHYKFQLVGFDSTWQPVTDETQITYANLPPGKYTFKVLAQSQDGQWGVKPVSSCEIVINPAPPAFWRRAWFVILCSLGIGGLLFLLIRNRERRLRLQRELLEDEVRERTSEISRQNEEKTLLLKEIHHRVKNNLQVISSLLNLQSEGITDPRVLALFEDCRHRINSMALIHEKMYQSKNLANVDLVNYIEDLVDSLLDVYDSNKQIRVESHVEDHSLHIDTIVPLGLIINEIVSNSLKYAFEGRQNGTIIVSFVKTGENRYMLDVSDNGIGMPAEIEPKLGSLGLQLIDLLTSQINGEVQSSSTYGTRYVIVFEEVIKDRF